MRHLALAAIAAATLVPALSSAQPGPAAPAPVKMNCPVGGGGFTYSPARPVAGIGLRPDGKPYGTGIYPPALPECPDSGLVLYKDYSSDEVKKLTPLATSEAYQALRSETQYYRAYWLMKQMGVDSDRYLLALLQAAWQADDRPELRARYLTEFVDESAKVESRPDDINWVGMQGRAINALRELGRFEEASTRLAGLPLDAVHAPVLDTGAAAEARTGQVRRMWVTYFESLKAAIARKDASLEPFDMIPRQLALSYCIDRNGLDAHQKSFCEKEKTEVEAMRTARIETPVDLKALSRPRSESGR